MIQILNESFITIVSKSANQRFSKEIESRSEVRKEVADTKGDEITATMTEAQKRHRQKLIEREKELLARGKKGKEIEIKSFRDRIEEFNSKLSTLTEHNDIPRISAAGNG
jgi:protein FAM32A